MNIPFEPYYRYSLTTVLCSFSQIMLQENAITGTLFLFAIALNSPVMLLGGLLATVSGLFVAKCFKYDSRAIEQGLYGFNAALVGIAVFYFFSVSLISLLLVLCGGVLATLLTHYFRIHQATLPVFTTPFIVTTWLLLCWADYVGLSRVDQETYAVIEATSVTDYGFATMHGIAQVMLQDSWLSGVIFLGALLYHSARVFIWAFIGSTVGILIAFFFNCSQELILQGAYSFNGCLVAIALSASKSYWRILLGILVSVFVVIAFENISLPALTAPFVIAVWFMTFFDHLLLMFTKTNNKADYLS